MKKIMSLGFIVLFSLFCVSCNPQGSLKAGSATSDSLLRLLPQTTRGVIMVDVHRAVTTDAAQKALKDETAKQKYEEFVAKVGIDPMKDIYFFVVAIAGDVTASDQDGAVILNLKYSKETLLAKLKEVSKSLEEETYNGITIYKSPDVKGSNKMGQGAFLDDSNIVVGNTKTIKGIIDVYQKKADPVSKSADMSKVLKTVNKAAIAWGAFAIPPDALKMAIEKNPMLKVLEGVVGLTMSFDYANKNLIAEIQTMGGAKEQNNQIATMLNGFKAMGATAAAKEPLAGELLNAIEITSGADFVKLYTRIPSETLEKIQKTAQERFSGLMKVKPAETKDEKKGEAEVKK